MAMATKSELKLQSSDGKVFKVDMEIIKCSGTIKTMLETLDPSEEDKEAIIPLSTVSSSVLQKIIEWAEHHKDDPTPVVQYADVRNKVKRTDDISDWDADFMGKMDQGTLFDMLLAANFLEVKSLMDLLCKSIANKMKGKTPEEIRGTFGIENDFSKEEEDQIREQNQWINNNK